MNNEFFREAIVKIKTRNVEGEVTKIFTASFYANQNNKCNQTLLVTAKHCMMDDDIQTLELNYHFGNGFQEVILWLHEFDVIEHPKLDLCIIKVKKQIENTWIHRIYNNDLFKNFNYNLLYMRVKVPGFYAEAVDVPIYETAYLCSFYNNVKFYIKSKNIIEGYSGAPVLIDLADNPNGLRTYVIGFVSKNLENDNIEVVSAINISTLETLIDI